MDKKATVDIACWMELLIIYSYVCMYVNVSVNVSEKRWQLVPPGSHTATTITIILWVSLSQRVRVTLNSSLGQA